MSGIKIVVVLSGVAILAYYLNKKEKKENFISTMPLYGKIAVGAVPIATAGIIAGKLYQIWKKPIKALEETEMREIGEPEEKFYKHYEYEMENRYFTGEQGRRPITKQTIIFEDD